MSTRTAGQIALLTTGAVVTGFLGYAVYFDYQRRHNASFRKGLRLQHKKIKAAADAKEAAQKANNTAALRLALLEIQLEAAPSSPSEQEAYFEKQVAEGERLALLGPDYAVKCASHFYRALRVYPQPVELLMIYQKVVPPQIFSLLLELTSLAPSPSDPAAPQPRVEASVADIDDSSPIGSESILGSASGSGASGGDWEKLSEEGKN